MISTDNLGYIENAVNGMPLVQFDGSSDVLEFEKLSQLRFAPFSL